MSKELEALENIKREAGIPYFSTLYDIDMWREDFKTVETALKNYEELEQKHNELLYNYEELVHCGMKSEQKKLEALEIIKRFVDFNVYEMQGRYYLTTGNNYRGQISISKEEFDLLEEILK